MARTLYGKRPSWTGPTTESVAQSSPGPEVSRFRLMLERLIEHVNTHGGAAWLTFELVAASFIRRSPRKEISP
jgi:hypothetical protein